jgi:hypothetical protein
VDGCEKKYKNSPSVVGNIKKHLIKPKPDGHALEPEGSELNDQMQKISLRKGGNYQLFSRVGKNKIRYLVQ